jgi:hypothetical protein
LREGRGREGKGGDRRGGEGEEGRGGERRGGEGRGGEVEGSDQAFPLGLPSWRTETTGKGPEAPPNFVPCLPVTFLAFSSSFPSSPSFICFLLSKVLLKSEMWSPSSEGGYWTFHKDGRRNTD